MGLIECTSGASLWRGYDYYKGNKVKNLQKINDTQYTADVVGTMNEPSTQATIGRYEQGLVDVSLDKLFWYAETFEVSLDYIFGRTDDPKGHLYEKDEPSLPSDASINDFIEFCFDPTSPANAKLKKMLVQLMEDSQK